MLHCVSTAFVPPAFYPCGIIQEQVFGTVLLLRLGGAGVHKNEK